MHQEISSAVLTNVVCSVCAGEAVAASERMSNGLFSEVAIRTVVEQNHRQCLCDLLDFATTPKGRDFFHLKPHWQQHRKRADTRQAAEDSVEQFLLGVAIRHAARVGNVELLMVLHSRGAGLNEPSPSPLDVAVFHGKPKVVEKLLSLGVQVNGDELMRLLQAAEGLRSSNHFRCFKMLVQHNGVDINAAEAGGHSGLHSAVLSSDHWLTEAMCRLGADPNRGSPAGHTPLHDCVTPGAVRLLTSFGAEVSNYPGKTRTISNTGGYPLTQEGRLELEKDGYPSRQHTPFCRALAVRAFQQRLNLRSNDERVVGELLVASLGAPEFDLSLAP